jgi:septum formation protein
VAKTNRFILASASARRLDLLAQIGVTADLVDAAEIDESVHARELPRVYAARMAVQKLNAVAPRHDGAFVLAADTVVACGRRILPKAEDVATARQCLERLSGGRHRVYGGLIVQAPDGRRVSRVVLSAVVFKRLSKSEITDYLDSGEWHGKAGGYAIQGRAARFVQKLNGSYSNIVGLPLYEVAQVLDGIGWRG